MAVLRLDLQRRRSSPYTGYLAAAVVVPRSAFGIVIFASIVGVMMAPWYWSSAAVTLVVASLGRHDGVIAAASSSRQGDQSWHAPAQTDLNNLDKVLAGDGVYGFIYNSSHTPDELYGVYNWCNMPHVRSQEYVRAKAGYELQYVELVSPRHEEYNHVLPCQGPFSFTC
jgi:hypothetical protein